MKRMKWTRMCQSCCVRWTIILVGLMLFFFLSFSRNVFLLLKQYVWISNNDDNKNDDDNDDNDSEDDDDDSDCDGDGDHWSLLPDLYPFF